MAKNGFKAMDSDMHVFEPADLWQRYIDPKYADRAPVGLKRSSRDLGIEVEGKVLPIPRNPENPALAKYRNDFFTRNTGTPATETSTVFLRSWRWIRRASMSPFSFRRAVSVCWVSMGSIRISPRPSLAPTTIGSMISRRPRRTACTASRW